MSPIRQFISRIRRDAVQRPGVVKTVSMGRERVFEAYDLGDDTFIFERGISARLGEHPSVLMVEKGDLRHRQRGRVLTLSTGNHSVAAFPLLDGRFWSLSSLPSNRRSETLAHAILCANVVDDTIEISQREISTASLVITDAWLLDTVGFSMADIVFGERNVETLAHYRKRGQEWRVKPLAWTEGEMRVALAAARKRIATKLSYYHSVRGVHFMSYSEFVRFAELAESDSGEFVRALRELVSIDSGNRCSFVRMPKYHGHHEVEFFGMIRGTSETSLIPELEKLMEAITLGRIGRLGIIQRAQELVELYHSLLARAELADESSKVFVETLYMYITGEVYAVVGEGSTRAFDDRRTALPGATFVNGRQIPHPGADARTEVLMANLRGLMSKDEIIEYANVYELRGDDDDAPLGRGATREIVYKTNRRPLTLSLIEKRLARASRGYTSYMLARVGALRALGIGLSDNYLMLKRRANAHETMADYYIRSRCEGEPMEAIPENFFRSAGDSSSEDPEVVLALATQMGDAAAQNMAMKKFDPRNDNAIFGVGKEIYAFDYDIMFGRVMPKRVSTCSVRGSFGWPSLERTEANFRALANFYLLSYAHALRVFQARHPSVKMAEAAKRFWDGFDFRIRALAWQLTVHRDDFEAFRPDIPAKFRFEARWRFVLWALEQQEQQLPLLRKLFFQKVKVVANEDIRNNPEPFRL